MGGHQRAPELHMLHVAGSPVGKPFPVLANQCSNVVLAILCVLIYCVQVDGGVADREWVCMLVKCMWSFFILTLHIENDRLAGLVLAILVVDSLGVVAASIWCHRGQNDQGVVQSESTERKNLHEINWPGK